MSDGTTKVNISLGDCILEFSGSEAFVQKQIDEFKESIHSKLKPIKAQKLKDKPKGGQSDKVDDLSQDPTVNPYPNVIDYDGEDINILKVDGNNSAAKTKNLALIYLLAKEKFGKSPVPTQDIKKQCETHGCLDASNFSSTLKSIDKKNVVLKGSGKSQTIKLTAPGRTKAKELVESLN